MSEEYTNLIGFTVVIIIIIIIIIIIAGLVRSLDKRTGLGLNLRVECKR